MSQTTKQFKCWEFKGRGDAFFGGDADDRVLYRHTDGRLEFLPSFNAQFSKATPALFESQEEAETAGIQASTRMGLISGIEV